MQSARVNLCIQIAGDTAGETHETSVDTALVEDAHQHTVCCFHSFNRMLRLWVTQQHVTSPAVLQAALHRQAHTQEQQMSGLQNRYTQLGLQAHTQPCYLRWYSDDGEVADFIPTYKAGTTDTGSSNGMHS
jgi:hypothetical protein